MRQVDRLNRVWRGNSQVICILIDERRKEEKVQLNLRKKQRKSKVWTLSTKTPKSFLMKVLLLIEND